MANENVNESTAETQSPVETQTTDNANSEVVNENAVTLEADGTADNAGSPDENSEAPRSRAKERIEDLVAERNAAKEYAEFWRTKSLELMNVKNPPVNEAPSFTEDTPMPDIKQFNGDTDKWSRAVSEWTRNQIALQTQKTIEQVNIANENKTVLQQFEAKIDKFRSSHADFDTVMANPKLPVLDKTASAMVVASDFAAELTYALGRDPSMAVRISRMKPAQQALAIGRLEAQLATQIQPQINPSKSLNTSPPAKQPVKVTTQAPPPPEPIPSGGTPNSSPEDMDISEWMRSRRDEVRSRRR